MSDVRIHPTAIVEEDVDIGAGTAVWDNVHLRRGVRIGRDCIIGEKSYLAPDVVLGDRVKVNAFVYLCTGVTVETGVMLSAGTTFTNDMLPRATTSDLGRLRSSEPDDNTLDTLVREGATLGARTVVGPGLEIGRFAMIGMGSVVTHSIPDFHLALGSPARSVGAVCRCGAVLERWQPAAAASDGLLNCSCGYGFELRAGAVRELSSAQPEG